MTLRMSAGDVLKHDYGDALSKSILFFEGQRSGKLPSSQRMRWRKDSALSDGHDVGVDLAGGYYDAGDNVKFHFPMAFSTTMLAWSVLEFGKLMGPADLHHTLEAIRWATDYFLKATRIPGLVFAQVGNPYGDHNCWERPEDMDTPRTTYAVSRNHPGSEVAAEIAAALASSSIVFRTSNLPYSLKLLKRAMMDELLWASAWLHRASRAPIYWKYIVQNIHSIETVEVKSAKSLDSSYRGGSYAEFGWDSKHAGINILVSKDNVIEVAQVCVVKLGGLLFKPGGSNLQHATALSFLLLVYARNSHHVNRDIHCGDVAVTPSRLIEVAKNQLMQADYILGSNPMNMSYMVGYGDRFPEKIHHRASSMPSLDKRHDHIGCKGGTPYYLSDSPNPNLLIGAIVGGPDINDSYVDSRALFVHSEPTTYINAPMILGVYDWPGFNPVPPEYWLLPSFLPIHQGCTYCDLPTPVLGRTGNAGARTATSHTIYAPPS
ncbi:hypothetical protein Syun_012663 [Stephania yunnanensis]|uniref:Endoglucanase n=1 Tax=Stephania yunnanensis TaxID=152371 RepID=A0AAP0JZU0_9MAGN